MQAIKITNQARLIANQQLRGQLMAKATAKREQQKRRRLHRLVVFLTRPGWDAL